MSLNGSGLGEGLKGSSSHSPCSYNLIGWEQQMDQLYSYFYLMLFVPGLLLNTLALWVLCRHISKKTKAVIFMINLALADLAHVLSLPLRVYYYFTHTWPFGRVVCLLCFYLKYLNMYAAIVFLVCISAQRCVFLLHPFCARRWRRRYDLLISALVWLLVGLSCSPFIIMRTTSNATASPNPGLNPYTPHTQSPMPTMQQYVSPVYTSHHPMSSQSPPKAGCFKDLPMRRLSMPLAITLMALAEMLGFVLPLAAISYSSIRIVRSLRKRRSLDTQSSSAPLSPTIRPFTSSAFFPSRQAEDQTDNQVNRQTDGEKRRALRMVLSCFSLFLLCFAPYHINFLLYLMVSQGIVSHCATRLAVHQFHPVSLCLASVSCCLNPLLYYFLTSEFRRHFSRRTSSFTSSMASSPLAITSERPTLLRERLTSMERDKTGGRGSRPKMSLPNSSCESSEDLKTYQHHVYAVVYSVILVPGLLGNVLALWVFQAYVRETKRAVVFMMNLAVADLMQVLSLPLRIYYYLNKEWPFGHTVCMLCFYLKYVNMYASIFFLVCVSVRRCELIMRPLQYNSSRHRGDIYVCVAGWLLVCLGCLPFPLLRNPHHGLTRPALRTNSSALLSSSSPLPTSNPAPVCFAELPMRPISAPAAWALLVGAELVGFILPLVLVLACACLTAGSLRERGEGAVQDQGEKRKALRMVLTCAVVFLICFAPYHITMPLDFLAKSDSLGSCALRNLVLRCHPVTLCLASLNSGLDPLMYYFTTGEFRRRFSRPDIPESFSLSRRLSCGTGECKNLTASILN
ncbi:uncharacterized protein FYW47_013791 [Aplochiton taeniatus]